MEIKTTHALNCLNLSSKLVILFENGCQPLSTTELVSTDDWLVPIHRSMILVVWMLHEVLPPWFLWKLTVDFSTPFLDWRSVHLFSIGLLIYSLAVLAVSSIARESGRIWNCPRCLYTKFVACNLFGLATQRLFFFSFFSGLRSVLFVWLSCQVSCEITSCLHFGSWVYFVFPCDGCKKWPCIGVFNPPFDFQRSTNRPNLFCFTLLLNFG